MECIHAWQNRTRKSQKVLEHESVKRNVIQILKTWSQISTWTGIYEMPWLLFMLNAELNAQHSFMFHAIGFNAQIDINICDIWDKMFTLFCTYVIQAIQDEKQKFFASLQAMTFVNSSTSAKTMNEYQTWWKNHRNYALHDPNPNSNTVWMLCFVNI